MSQRERRDDAEEISRGFTEGRHGLPAVGARGARLVPTLAGFNMGVELAQLSLVLLVLPFLFRARKSAFYAWRFMPAASLGAAMAGAAWLVARVSV